MSDKGQTKKGGKKGRKLGRGKKKCEAYKRQQTREKNKIVRVADSSGPKRAIEYARKHLLGEWAKERLARRGYIL